MKKFFQLITVAFLVGSFSFSTVIAQNKKQSTKQYNYYMMNSNSIAEQRTNMLSAKVNLSEGQKAQVMEVEIKLAEEQEYIQNIYKRNGDRDEMKANTIKAIQIHDAEIQKILTPEQKNQLSGVAIPE